MIEYREGILVFACDGPDCKDVLTTGFEPLRASYKALEELGWRVLSPDMGHKDPYLHLCPQCKVRMQTGQYDKDVRKQGTG